MYDAIEKGFQIAKGDIFCWLNAGDIYFPWTASAVEETFKKFPSIDWLTGVPCTLHDFSRVEICSYTPIYSQWVIRKGFHNGHRLPLIQQESTFWTQGLWERSDAAEILRGQGRGKGYACDYKLWCRFAQFSKLHTVRSPLAAFAVTPGQISEKHRAQYFRECGVPFVPARPNQALHQMFKLLSVIRARRSVFAGAKPPAAESK